MHLFSIAHVLTTGEIKKCTLSFVSKSQSCEPLVCVDLFGHLLSVKNLGLMKL